MFCHSEAKLKFDMTTVKSKNKKPSLLKRVFSFELLLTDEVLVLVDGVGHQRHKARPFDAFCKRALMFGAGAGLSRGVHFGLHRDKLTQ